MSDTPERRAVLKLTDGLRFEAGSELWSLDPLKVFQGTWVALVPGGEDPIVDPSGFLAWVLATMVEPVRGNVELFGEDVYRLDYAMRQRLRARIGFVHGYGGLISNRTVRENVALPVSVHGRLSARDEDTLVAERLDRLALSKVADLQPHEMDGATRWRACLARALVLDPEWLVLEGHGNWEMDRGRGKGWTYLIEKQRGGNMATTICLPRQNPEFEAWFSEHGGVTVRYTRIDIDEDEKVNA